MSAEILRRAASLMRERAEASSPSPWEAFQSTRSIGCFMVAVDDEHTVVADPLAPVNAEHIASWHPAVASAVADLLDVIASDVGTSTLAFHAAADFTRAYLGSDS